MAAPNTLARDVSSVTIIHHFVESDGVNPNCAVHGYPLLVYKNALDLSKASDPPSMIERLLHSNGFPPQLRFGLYKESHYHSTTHEVLVVHRGTATCEFGGPVRGIKETLEPGDVVIVPAGLAHRVIQDEGRFEMIGAYPIGCEWDMCYGANEQECQDKMAVVKKVKPVARDPIWGKGGPIMSFWT